MKNRDFALLVPSPHYIDLFECSAARTKQVPAALNIDYHHSAYEKTFCCKFVYTNLLPCSPSILTCLISFHPSFTNKLTGFSK